MDLRPYQRQIVEALRAAYAGGARAPLLVAPTGAGKTVILAEVARGAQERRRRLLIVAHRIELIRQASAKLGAIGVPHGIIAPGSPALDLPVQVGSVQTVARRLPDLAPFDLIALDEAHHAVAGSWQALVQAQPSARLLGVTATPQRLDGRGLGREAGGPFDALVLGPSIGELIQGRYLVPTRVFAAQHAPDLSRVKTARGDFDVRALAEVMDTSAVTGDAVVHYRRHAEGRSAICFCVSVQHAEDVARAFRQAGYRAQAAHGELHPRLRERMLSGLGTGAVQIVCSAELISEGLDVPAVGAVILLRPTQSLALHLQQVGRGLRPAPAKSHLIVLDHAGNTLRHGFAEQSREWSLAGRPKGPPRVPAVRVCPTCYCAHAPALHCPACGHGYGTAAARRTAPEQRGGDLRELDRASVETIRAAKLDALIASARTVDHLRLIARARGYHPAWVQRQVQMRPRFQRAAAR